MNAVARRSASSRFFADDSGTILALPLRLPHLALFSSSAERLDLHVDSKAGKSSFMASTVWGVGSKMSMSRLCVRIRTAPATSCPRAANADRPLVPSPWAAEPTRQPRAGALGGIDDFARRPIEHAESAA
jgi:hypothetical protein